MTDQAPTLTAVAAHGNRSMRYACAASRPDGYLKNNIVVCKDGARLSVIAGAGAYSVPRPGMCLTSKPCGSFWPGLEQAGCDYDGPYTHVEVMLMQDCGEPSSWAEWENGGVYAAVPVEVVRALILEHGGEVE